MPGDSGVLVVTRVRSTTTTCTRDRGCSGHPAFPTPSLGAKGSCTARAHRALRSGEVMFEWTNPHRVIFRRCPSWSRKARPMTRLRIEPGSRGSWVWSCGPSRNDGVWIARHCERSQSTLSFRCKMDCFAEPVIGRRGRSETSTMASPVATFSSCWLRTMTSTRNQRESP